MNRKLEIVLYTLMFLCALSTFITYVILNKRLIGCVLSVVLCCVYCLIWKLEKKKEEKKE